MTEQETLDLFISIEDPKTKMLICRAMKAFKDQEVNIELKKHKKLSGTDATFPVGMYGQHTEDGLNVLQSFAMNAPDIIPEWFKGDTKAMTNSRQESKESIYFQWRTFYAKRMIVELNKELK